MCMYIYIYMYILCYAMICYTTMLYNDVIYNDDLYNMITVLNCYSIAINYYQVLLHSIAIYIICPKYNVHRWHLYIVLNIL